MNKDLEEQLEELGPGCRAVVSRLRAAKTVEPREGQGRRSRSTAEWLIAASVLFVFGLSVQFLTIKQSNNISSNQTISPRGPREYHQTPAEMIATQRPDGSWQNDFLTRRNAAALAECEEPAARIAYKKAMRNLRSRGIL